MDVINGNGNLYSLFKDEYNMFRKKEGFTLAELLIVIAIIAILAAIAIPVYASTLDKSKATVCAHNIQTVERGYIIHLMLDDGKTIQDVMAEDFGGEEVKCPAGGVYSVMSGDGSNTNLHCSVHGAPKFMYDFGGIPDKARSNLPALMADMQRFADSLASQGLFIAGNSAATLTVSPTFNSMFRDAAGNLTKTSVLSEMQKYFGADSNILNSSPNPWRVVVGTDQKIVSISYKSGRYGYIIYADGSMYELDNAYYSGSAAFGGYAPIGEIAMDKSRLDELPGLYSEIK